MSPARKTFVLLSSAFIIAFAAFSLTGPAPMAAEKLNREEVRALVKEYLIEHPEVVVEALESYQANQEEIEKRAFKQTFEDNKNLLHGDGLPFAGNPDGDVVIVEFFDYNCGYCKRAVSEINKVLENDKNVKFVFREMPILSEASALAARYAMAAHKQGKYFDYHMALMKAGGAKTEKSLEKIGADLGLDVAKLSKDAASPETRAAVENSLAVSRKLGIRGTPAFVIGDTLVPGYITYDAMIKEIERVRNGEG